MGRGGGRNACALCILNAFTFVLTRLKYLSFLAMPCTMIRKKKYIYISRSVEQQIAWKPNLWATIEMQDGRCSYFYIYFYDWLSAIYISGQGQLFVDWLSTSPIHRRLPCAQSLLLVACFITQMITCTGLITRTWHCMGYREKKLGHGCYMLLSEL